MGDGQRLHFWFDIWIDGEALRVRLSQVFAIARDKDSSIEKVFNEGRAGGNVMWI